MAEWLKLKLLKIRLFVKYHVYDLKHGCGIWGELYPRIGKRFNALRPLYWRRNKPPHVELPDGYQGIVPTAYNTGDGWWLHWGALYDGEGRNAFDELWPEPLCEIVEHDRHDDFSINEWPLIIPWARSSDLEKVGFYIA